MLEKFTRKEKVNTCILLESNALDIAFMTNIDSEDENVSSDMEFYLVFSSVPFEIDRKTVSLHSLSVVVGNDQTPIFGQWTWCKSCSLEIQTW